MLVIREVCQANALIVCIPTAAGEEWVPQLYKGYNRSDITGGGWQPHLQSM